MAVIGLRTAICIALTVCLLHTDVLGAYKNDPCPAPCSCYNFQGTQGVWCNGTGISDIPNGIPVNTQLLDISFNNIHKIPKYILQHLVNLVEIDFGGNPINDDSIEPGALDLPLLRTVGLWGSGSRSLFDIPDKLPKNMTKLYFFYNLIETLKKDSFVSYPHLNYIDLSNNAIDTIEKGVFDPLPDLGMIYLPFNKINDSSIPPTLFAKNLNLYGISLRFNKLEHILTDLPISLTSLDYVGNNIKTLPSYGFMKNPNLTSLSFWQGQVTTIEDNAFYGLEKLTILDFMQGNILSPLTNKTFNGLTGLQTLYIDLNNISRIDTGAFRSFSSISALWLDGNQLTALEPEVLNTKYMPHLSTLYISFNPWYCDCHLRWLREKVDNATYGIQDPHLIKCAGPKNVAGKAWDALQPSDFVCPE